MKRILKMKQGNKDSTSSVCEGVDDDVEEVEI